jgi:hypothetical protein
MSSPAAPLPPVSPRSRPIRSLQRREMRSLLLPTIRNRKPLRQKRPPRRPAASNPRPAPASLSRLTLRHSPTSTAGLLTGGSAGLQTRTRSSGLRHCAATTLTGRACSYKLEAASADCPEQNTAPGAGQHRAVEAVRATGPPTSDLCLMGCRGGCVQRHPKKEKHPTHGQNCQNW